MAQRRREGPSARLWTGTSGWAYPHWKDVFYPKGLASKDYLRFYASQFRTTEINYTFYHLARRETFRKWSAQVPEGFQFAVKAHRSITHVKRLLDVQEVWSEFVGSAEGLGGKLGPVLLQFPPSFRCDFGAIRDFLAGPLGGDLGSLRLAFEFRHASWFQERVAELLKDHGAAMVIADSSRYPQAPLQATASFVYLRFHGPGALFSSSYGEPELRLWAGRIRGWLGEGLDVYAYFNNDAHGCAVQNARRLHELVGE